MSTIILLQNVNVPLTNVKDSAMTAVVQDHEPDRQ
jgi:hypothetical protein